MRRSALLALVIAGTGSAWAGPDQPYAGLEHRALKALSDEQIADLRAGRGMGLALAAELNGYPGPAHVLELADALELTPAQRDRVRRLHEAMKAEAVGLGERLIAEETDLDRSFAERTVTVARLEAATAAIARTQGALRAAHLKYHLAAAELLTPAQIRRYAELRGYGTGPVHGPHRHHGAPDRPMK
jgi:Spy/CpxP family protein refolding chaperone